MIHPLERWPATRRRAAFVGLLLAFLVAETPLLMVNGTLTTDAAPSGILSMELAGTAERAEEIRASWEAKNALDEAGFSLGLDFLLMPIYSTGLATFAALGAAAMRRRGLAGLASIGAVLGWGAWVGAAFDVVETGLTVPMLDRPTDTLAAVVRAAATVKFTLLGLALAFAVVAAVIAVLRRPA